MPEDLDQTAGAATENVQVACVRIAAQSLLHLQRQPMHALAHVGVSGRQPDPDAAWNRDHRASDRSTAATSFAGAFAAIRTTEPPVSTTIAGGGGAAPSRDSVPTTTGAKPEPARLSPQRSRRHR